MKYTTLLIGMICSAIFLSNCNDEKLTKMPVSQEALAYVDFKVGSYWVYEDSVSGSIDSIVLLSRDDSYVVGDIYQEEEIEYTYYSSFRQSNFTAELFHGNDSISTRFKRDIDPLPIYVLICPGVEYLNEYDSFKVNGKVFKWVKRFSDEQEFISYFSKGVGLVKLVTVDFMYPDYSYEVEDVKEVWELVRYSVIK